MSTDRIYSQKQIERLLNLGGQDFLEKMFGIYETYGAERIEDLAKAFIEGDHEKISKTAHALKSSSGNMGANEVYDDAHALETAASANVPLMTELHIKIEGLTEAYKRSLAVFRTNYRQK